MIMLLTVGLTTAVWLTVTFLTKPESDATLVAFFRRTHPGTIGWRRIAAMAPDVVPDAAGARNLVDWIAGCALVYGILFGVGKVLLHEVRSGIPLLAMGVIAGAVIYLDLSRRGWESIRE